MDVPTVQRVHLAGTGTCAAAVGEVPLPNCCVGEIMFADRSKVLGTATARHYYARLIITVVNLFLLSFYAFSGSAVFLFYLLLCHIQCVNFF